MEARCAKCFPGRQHPTMPHSSSCCSACELQNINCRWCGDRRLWRELGCTAGAAFLLSRSLLLALKCPQAPLLLCTSCSLVFAASAPFLSGRSEMCPLDAHLDAAPLLLSLSQLAWRRARSCWRRDFSRGTTWLVLGVQSWSVKPWEAPLGEDLKQA